MKRFSTLAAVAALSAGCVQTPESIAPAYVSLTEYRDLSCSELRRESRHLDQALAEATPRQKTAASNDVAALIIIGAPISKASGKDLSEQIADIKGRQKTLKQTQIQKGC